MSETIIRRNKIYTEYFKRREDEGKGVFILRGGRRSGKTYAICQQLIRKVLEEHAIVNMAAMTSEQGRLGAYSDCKAIIGASEALAAEFDILSSPREIRHKFGSGRMFFNSYQDPETAKGVACDYLYINEANNFSKQQYTDLAASVRKGIFLDFNPNTQFWVDELFSEEDILTTTWEDNKKYLTPLQLQYFDDLKAAAEKPNASPIDIRNYNVYYLGQYSELRGKIFSPDSFTFRDAAPADLYDFAVFCDPSALRGADWFACVLSAKSKTDGKVYIVDVFSTNQGSREMICHKLREWCGMYDRVRVYVETNGIIGLDFFDFAYNSGLPVEAWYSKGNKFERIVANYQNLTENTVLVRSAQLTEFLGQVYEFDTKCEHDDNVDALSSSYTLQKYY